MKLHLRKIAAALFVILLGAAPVANAALVTRNVLKTFFEKGDKPTQPQFATLIDSMVNINDDGNRLNLYFDYGPSIEEHSVSLSRAWLYAQSSDGNLINFQDGRSIGPPSLEQVLVNHGLLGASSLWAGQSGNVGLMFELADSSGDITRHYGFVQMSVDAATSATPYAIHINRFVYETTPDTPITTFNAVPVPAAAWLFGSGLLGLIGMVRRRAV